MDENLAFYLYTFDGRLIGEFTKHVTDYDHEHIEGPYRASWLFREEEEGTTTPEFMKEFFNSRMMHQVKVEYDGSEVWSGYIWQMELEEGKLVRTKSMDNTYNAVAIPDPEAVEEDEHQWIRFHFTSPTLPNSKYWGLNLDSIAEYGRHEVILSGNGSDGEALEYGLTTLERSSDPFDPAIIVQEAVEFGSLRVTAVGRQVVANKVQLMGDQRRYHPDHTVLTYGTKEVNGIAWTVGDEIKRLVEVIEYVGGWLHVASIAENHTVTRIGSNSAGGAWDRIVELSKLRNPDKEYYTLSVNDDGGVVYEKQREQPIYYLKTSETGVTYPDGTIPTWDARPGFVFDVTGSAGAPMPNTWLSDSRLTKIERVTMSDGDESASFHGRERDIGDLYSAIGRNRSWLNVK